MINLETQTVIDLIKHDIGWLAMITRFNERYSDSRKFSNAMLYIIQSAVNENEAGFHLKRSRIDVKMVSSLFFKTTH